MDLTASLRALRRQWILTGFLLVLTFAAGVAAWVKMPGPYSTQSIVVLMPSQQASKLNGNNPYMSYGGSENVAGDIVLRQVMDPATMTALASRGYTASYTVADDPNTSGPILDITVTGKSQALVENTLHGVTSEVQSKVVALQSFLTPANRITSQVISFHPTATLQVSKKARTIVLIVGLGLVLTYALPQILDAELRRRRGETGGGETRGGDRVSGYGPPPAREDEQAPYQQPSRRRYRPTVDEPEPVPAGGGRSTPRPYGPTADEPEPVPAGGGRSMPRPYVDRQRGGERAAPVPTDDGGVPNGTGGVPNGTPDRRASREAARRREFTY